MLRRLLLYSFLLIIVENPAFSQDTLLAKIDTPAATVSIDNLDNIYIVSSKNEFLKFDAGGMLQGSYSNKNLGTDFVADVSNPLRIVLYSPAFQQLILLNNKLSEIFTYRFKDLSRRITLLAPAEDNTRYWAFDENRQQLCRLGINMEDEYLSGDIFQLAGIRMHPEQLLVSNQYIYLYDSAAGLMQFDNFGTYLRFIPEKGQKNIQIKDNKLMRIQKGRLAVTDISSGGNTFLNLPELPGIKQAVLGTNVTALGTSAGIFIFRRSGPAKLN